MSLLIYYKKLSSNQTLLPDNFPNITTFTTTNSSGSFSVVDGKANVTGTMIINWGTLHENSESIAVVKELVNSDFMFGFKSGNTFGYVHSEFIKYDKTSGKIFVYNKNGKVLESTESNTNYTLGDTLKLTVKRLGINFTFKVDNITKNWSISYSVSTVPTGSPFVAHNQAKPAFIVNSGNIEVSSYRLLNLASNIDYMPVGDSITYGQAATSESNRWAELVNGNNIVNGGGADVTQSVVNRLDEIIAIKPKKVLLMIGGNDILFNVASATWKQNLRDIRATLSNAGIEVIHCYPTPRSGASTLISFINSEPTFQNDLKIDTNTPLMNGNANTLASAYNIGDNLHPNNAGMALIASTINAVL